MATVDELWDWISPAIENLQADYRSEPGKSWYSRQEVILKGLGIQDTNSHPVAAALMNRFENLSDDERNGMLGSDQVLTMAREVVQEHAVPEQAVQQAVPEQAVQQAVPEQAVQPEEQGSPDIGFNEADWQTYLATNGPAWDGSAEAWPGFREWFEYYAVQQGLSTPASELLNPLETMSVPERIAEFARRGVTIAAPAPVAAPATESTATGLTGGEFGWVAEGQRDILQRLWGQDWPTRLSQDLDVRWGADWQANPGEYKAAWLADLITEGAFTDGQGSPWADDQDSADDQATSDDDQPDEAEQAVLEDFAARVNEIPGIEQLSHEEIAQIIAEEMNRIGQ